jgi:hypothetical protein
MKCQGYCDGSRHQIDHPYVSPWTKPLLSTAPASFSLYEAEAMVISEVDLICMSIMRRALLFSVPIGFFYSGILRTNPSQFLSPKIEVSITIYQYRFSFSPLP